MADEKKTGFVGRLIKFALWSAAAFFLFVILLAVTLPLWISPVATGVAGRVVPGYTGTDFRIESFRLNPYSGSLCVNGVKLSNPEGFGEAAAFSLSNFSVEMTVGSIFSDTILVRNVTIEDAFVSYYSHGGKNNFDVILANVEKAGGSKVEKTEEEAPAKSRSSQKKVIIEKVRISGTKVKLMKSDMMPPFVIPPVELTDVGKKSGGATLEEAWTQIADGVMKSFAAAGDGLGALGSILGDGAKGVSGTVNGGMKDLSSVLDGFSGKGKSSKSAGETSASAKGDNVISRTTDVTAKTIGSVGDAAKNATDVVGRTAKGTIDAVGDTTKKAADGVKNLFKGLGK